MKEKAVTSLESLQLRKKYTKKIKLPVESSVYMNLRIKNQFNFQIVLNIGKVQVLSKIQVIISTVDSRYLDFDYLENAYLEEKIRSFF